MIGYYGYSMSNNAVSAYNSGRMPMSKAAPTLAREAKAIGFNLTVNDARLLLEALHDGEWHHTSKHFNRVNFYDVPAALEWLEYGDDGPPAYPINTFPHLCPLRPSRSPYGHSELLQLFAPDLYQEFLEEQEQERREYREQRRKTAQRMEDYRKAKFLLCGAGLNRRQAIAYLREYVTCSAIGIQGAFNPQALYWREVAQYVQG